MSSEGNQSLGQSPNRTLLVTRKGRAPWKVCSVCQGSHPEFHTPAEFCAHLKRYHCSKEGGSYVCRYGMNDICTSLPLEGVSDKDYEDHVAKDHVIRKQQPQLHSSGSMDSGSEMVSASREPAVVSDQHKWTIYMTKVNLPAALNNPSLSRRETDFFTKQWGDSFTDQEVMPSHFLPVISQNHFRKYLKRNGTKLRARLSTSLKDERDTSLPVDEFPVLHAARKRKTSDHLDEIPKIFLNTNFDLSQKEVFDAVFPWQLIQTTNKKEAPIQTSGASSSKLLQEKFSHYLDTVEVEIAKQISHKSEAFFHAMSSHDQLQADLATTLASIKHLREKIHNIEESKVTKPLVIMSHERRRANYIRLYDKLKMMVTVHQTQPTIQHLLATNDYIGALDLISTTQEVLAQELQGVHSFRHLSSQLAELEKLIDTMMHDEFVRYATADLNRPLTEGSALMEEDLLRALVLQERLVAIILGMLRLGKFSFVDVYREEAYTALKAVIKQTVIEAVADVDDVETEGVVASLADKMRLLDYRKWMLLLQTVAENLLVILHRVQAVATVMNGVVRVAARKHSSEPLPGEVGMETDVGVNAADMEEVTERAERMSLSQDVDVILTNAQYVKLGLQVREMLCHICDHAHDRAVKLLVARGRDGFLDRLSAAEFVELSRVVEQFVEASARVSGRRSMALGASLQTQSSHFVTRFHEERKRKLGLILDNERWKQANVPAEFQDLVDHIETVQQPLLCPAKEEESRSPSQFLYVNKEAYAVAGTALILLRVLVEYCQCVSDIPSLSSDMLFKLVDILKTFNSRTCQLILGAGALQLVGLKTITTKNLALVIRCLQLVLAFVPVLRRHFEARLHDKLHLLKHLDQVAESYTEHIKEIEQKLAAIMDKVLDSLLSKWEIKAPMPTSCFRNITKQFSKLHEAIIDLLPMSQVQDIFLRIHGSFKSHLRAQLHRSGVNCDGGPLHGLVVADVAFYIESIRSLSGLSAIDSSLDDIWKNS